MTTVLTTLPVLRSRRPVRIQSCAISSVPAIVTIGRLRSAADFAPSFLIRTGQTSAPDLQAQSQAWHRLDESRHHRRFMRPVHAPRYGSRSALVVETVLSRIFTPFAHL